MNILRLLTSTGSGVMFVITVYPSYANGPWNFGPFYSGGPFKSAYEACSHYSEDWASRNAVFYDGFELNY